MIKLEDTEINIKRKKRLAKLKIFNPLWELIKMFPDKNWDWDYISCNPNITFDIIINNLYKNATWNWKGISSNNFGADQI